MARIILECAAGARHEIEATNGHKIMEVARRMGIRGPSLNQYFPSRHACYDAR